MTCATNICSTCAMSALTMPENCFLQVARRLRQSTGRDIRSGGLLILSLYGISLVAVVLHVAVNKLEPNRRLASALGDRIVAVAAILADW
jgi:hypothetical protein